MASKYQIRADGAVLADLTQNDYVYSNAKMTTGVNKAGKLVFTLTPQNPQIKNVSPLKSTITVVNEKKVIWAGRVVRSEKNIYNQTTLTCEGSLAWLYDVLVAPTAFTNSTVESVISSLITTYNDNCSDFRQFIVGNIEGDDTITIPAESQYTSVFNLLSKIIGLNGGYFVASYNEYGTPILNYYKEGIPSISYVRFGENMVDINDYIDTTKVITALYATGDNVSLPSPHYIENVDAVATYGRIFGYQNFSGITTQSELVTQATNYLNQNMLGDVSITVKAIIFNRIPQVAEIMPVISKPNGINVNMIVSEVETDLNNPAGDKITLGTAKRTLTKTLATEGK